MSNKKNKDKKNSKEKEFTFEVDVKKLRESGAKLFITAPMYGGGCTGPYAKSLMQLASLLTQHGIPYSVWFLFNESLVQRGRNYCADTFMRSDCTHMIFIDSDISFNAPDVLHMLSLMVSDPAKYDILAGPYPKKCITWETVKTAVDMGYADNDPNELTNFVGDFVLNFKDAKTFKMTEPVEVSEIGTGFMMIARSAFEKFQEKFPQNAYLPDHNRTEEFSGNREIFAYFHCDFDESRRYLSEDYYFCRKVNEAGGKIWLAPWVYLQHTGTYTFAGRLDAISLVKSHMNS